MPRTPSAPSLGEASEALSAAAALGMLVPAPAGTTVYLVNMRGSYQWAVSAGDFNEDYSTTLAVCTNFDAAIRALAAEMRRRWTFDNTHFERRYAPWMTEQLYQEATAWRTAGSGAVYGDREPLAAATAALTELRRLETEWFAAHDDTDIVLHYALPPSSRLEEALLTSGRWLERRTVTDLRVQAPGFSRGVNEQHSARSVVSPPPVKPTAHRGGVWL